MAKTLRLEWSELKNIGKPVTHPVVTHFKKHGVTYVQIILCAGAMFFSPHNALASGSLDASGNAIYKKITNIGKWIILIKGAIDIIQNVTQGDFQAAKKSFMGYIMIYGVLFALPWGMNQVETVFSGLQ